jgi:hypothetical protein
LVSNTFERNRQDGHTKRRGLRPLQNSTNLFTSRRKRGIASEQKEDTPRWKPLSRLLAAELGAEQAAELGAELAAQLAAQLVA